MLRRDFLKASTITVFGAGFPFSGVNAQSRYAKYAGQTVTMSIPDYPQYQAMVKLLPEFTRATGIKVETDKLNIARIKDKQLIEMSKSQGDYDLASYIGMWKSEYVAKKLIQPLEPYFASQSLADPHYQLDDIIPTYLETLGLVGGPKGYLKGPGAKLYGLPYGGETSILAYRRDIFEKHQLQVPVNYTQFAELLRTIKSKEGIGALTSRGQAGHHAVHAWLLHLNPLGGSVFDDLWRPTFNDSIGVAALKFLQEVVATGPTGITHFDQAQSNLEFLEGRSAMYLDSTLISGLVDDPRKSKIAGKVGFALHPIGTRRASQSGGLGLAITQNAKNANAAFLLLQWLTSKAQDIAVVKFGGTPNRLSTLSDPDMLRHYPEFTVFQESLNYAYADWRPVMPEWDKINVQALGVAISDALTGKSTAEDALNGVVGQVTAIMRGSGYDS